MSGLPSTCPPTANTEYHWLSVLPPGSSQKDQFSQGTLHTVSTLDSAMDHWNEVPPTPFSVEPASGMVPVGKTQKLKVKFSPLEVGDFESNLFCQ